MKDSLAGRAVCGIVVAAVVSGWPMVATADPADELPLIEVTSAAGSEVRPAAAYNKRGGRFWVLWDDTTTETIRGRFVTPTKPAKRGEADLGAEFTISDGSAEVDEPALAVSKSGDVLVTWNESVGLTDVAMGALLDHNAQLLVGPFQIDDPQEVGAGSGCDVRGTAVAYSDKADVWLVAFEERSTPDVDCATTEGIKGAIIGGDATSFGDVFDISTPGLRIDDVAAAYGSRNRSFLVVYEEDVSGGDEKVLGNLVTPNGDVGDPLLIAADPGEDNEDGMLDYDKSRNQFLVVWEGGKADRIEGRLVRPGKNGAATLLDRFFIDEAAAGSRPRDPSVAFRSNRFLVTWDQEPVDDRDMFGRSVARDGSLIGSTFALAEEEGVDENAPQDLHRNLACAQNKLCLALWEQAPIPDDGEGDIAARLLFNQP